LKFFIIHISIYVDSIFVFWGKKTLGNRIQGSRILLILIFKTKENIEHGHNFFYKSSNFNLIVWHQIFKKNTCDTIHRAYLIYNIML